MPRAAIVRRPAFTLIEMIVVVGVIAILAAILLPALSGATRRARKTDETNAIRQVGVAWNLYANANDERALPGYLPETVQQDPGNAYAWNVRYRTVHRERFVSANDAEPWPFRLAAYLDHDHDVFLGYRSLEYETSLATTGDLDGDGIIDLIDPAWGENDLVYNQPTGRPTTIARQPAFGYNAYYVGGWYRYENVPGEGPIPRIRYGRTWSFEIDGSDSGPIGAVATSPSSIRQTSKMILFCSATGVAPGTYGRLPDDRPGMHFVVPRWMEVPYATTMPALEQRLWWPGVEDEFGMVTQTTEAITVRADAPDEEFCSIPIGRHTGQAAVLHADLHVSSPDPGALGDMTMWVNGATHSERPAHRRPP